MYIKNRIKLLSNEEINDIYAFPIFNEIEQSLYFDFTDQEWKAIKKYHTAKAKISLMLSIGYFKAKQQLYRISLNSCQAMQYIVKKYFENIDIDGLSGYIDKKTYAKQKADLLILFDYQIWSSELEGKIKSWVCKLLRYYPKPLDALRQCNYSAYFRQNFMR